MQKPMSDSTVAILILAVFCIAYFVAVFLGVAACIVYCAIVFLGIAVYRRWWPRDKEEEDR